ncbi:MAG: rod shape-determining protein MreC [Candidatus Staskawiczbacteria bacterium]|nr:rod shape-determining protein MreC [Candidatus Staskawiczbacteria bacterium]
MNFFNSGIRNNFFALSAPLQKFFWSAGESSSGFLASIFNGGSFFKENQNLKSENQKLLEQVVSLQAIIGGNQAQSTVSSACQNDEFKLQMAGVVGLEKEDNLTINKGSASGILEGMPVITEQKALLGKISKVYKDYSEVMLISNKNSVINVRILQSNPEIDGVLKGSGGLQVYLDLVPVDDTLNSGDTLVTSALEGTFPKDLLVGKITKVEKNDQNPHQQAQVQPFFNISSDNLFVITNYKQK